MPSISQTEYDVTAYRNVLDQLKTLQDRTKSLNAGLRVELAKSIPYAISGPFQAEVSGFMMKDRGGKSKTRWNEVVSKEIGIGKIKAPFGNNSDMQRWKRGMRQLQKKPQYNVGPASLRSHVYDLLSLIRNLQWEMNRLRIEMPTDLRQLASQMNQHASDFGSTSGSYTQASSSLPSGFSGFDGFASFGRGPSERQKQQARESARSNSGGGNFRRTSPVAATRFYPTDPIPFWEVFKQTKKLEEKWVPEMLSKVRAKIRKAKLAKKVAEENQRREMEKTRKSDEQKRKEREAKRKEAVQEQNRAKSTGRSEGTDKMIPKPDVNRLRDEKYRTTVVDPSEGKRLQKQNSEAMKTQAKNEGDTTGTGKGGVAVAGALALLAIAGAG